MDEQFRNRLKRYADAPVRARPNAPPPPVVTRPVPAAPKPPVVPHAAPVSPRESAPQVQGEDEDLFGIRPITKAPKLKRAKKPPRTKKSGRSKKKFVVGILALLMLASLVGLFVVKPRLHKVVPEVSRVERITQEAAAKKSEKIRLVAVGDTIAYSSINQAAKSGDDYNFAPMMAAMKPVFDKSDIRFCSQAVPAAGNGASVSGPPAFNAPTQLAKGLEATGCNLINLASNNINDKGQPAIDISRNNYDQHSNILAVAGANRSADEQKKISYFTVKGLKFAFLAYSISTNVKNPTPYGVNIYSDELFDAQIKEARSQQAGLVIVSMHWGTELGADVTPEQDAVAQHLASKNADIVLGHGAHVVQPVKVLNGADKHQTIVWFGLGNFVTSQIPIETLIGGAAVMDIDSATQNLLNPRLLPLYMHYEWTPGQKQKQSEADLLARKNFQVVPLDKAADLLAKSQNGTTIQAQQDRLNGVVSKYFKIPLITSGDL